MGDSRRWRQAIDRLASRQWGHVRRAQLRELGMPVTTIDSRVHVGKLIAVHAGVYAVEYRRVEPVARAAAAVLAGHPDAVLSHESAAALWGMRRWPAIAEITSPRHIRRPGITTHRSRTLTRGDTTTQLGIRTVTPFRAICDIWPNLTPRQRIRVPNDARLKHLISADQAACLLGHRRNPTRSGNEDELQHIVDRFDLPQYEPNVWVCGGEADAWYRDGRVVIEVDDPATHDDALHRADDRRRDTKRAQAGILTVRLLAEDLEADPAAVARQLAEILAGRTRAIS